MKSQWKKTAWIENGHGQRLLLKQIPDAEGQGILDPRVLGVCQASAGAENLFGLTMPLAAQRAAMGWPNRDLTGGAVDVQKRSIIGLNGPITLHIYRTAGERTRPCLLFFHGGGFFGGTCACVENDCKLLALAADAVVISVDYRLAPEAPFPAGLNDCLDAVNWAYTAAGELGIDAARIGVCGDSAGGNLAAVCALRDRDMGLGRIRFAGLIYPSVNLAGVDNPYYCWGEAEYTIAPVQSAEIKGAIYALDPHDMCTPAYYTGERDLLTHPYVAPLFAADLAGLPPTLIVNAEFDYLRLEGEAYGRRLAAAGVDVSLVRYQGMDHAFIDKLGDYPQAEDCMLELAAAFLKAVG